MRNSQGGAKFGVVLISVILLGVSAWFTQAQAAEVGSYACQQVQVE